MRLVLIVLVLVLVVGAVVVLQRRSGGRTESSVEDAKAEARRWTERLGGQVLNLTGTDTASTQAIADASERFTAASSQLEQASTVRQAELVTESAREGLYYVRAARTAMGMDPGPELPELPGQRTAGQVSEEREVDVEGRRLAASPGPTQNTPHYYPGGQVAGRPVPGGWYSEPWWKPALAAGAWGVGSVLLFSAMFSGMSGVGYDEQAFADGYGDGYADGAGGDQGGGDQGGADAGYDGSGYDGGGGFDGGDMGGGDMGGF